MALPKLTRKVAAQPYGVQPLSSHHQAETRGGFSRSRADSIGAHAVADVAWEMGPEAYEDFLDFVNDTIENASLPFLVDLVYDYHGPQEYTVKLIPDTLRFDSVDGLSYKLSASLELVPGPDAVFDATILQLSEFYGGPLQYEESLGMLERLANFVMPNTIG